MWDSITHWWHDLWAPSPQSNTPAPPPAPAPVKSDADKEKEAQTLHGMTLGMCGLSVPLLGGDHPTLDQAQTEWGMCQAMKAQEEQQKYVIPPPQPAPFDNQY